MKTERIRKRASYQMFKELLVFLNTNPSHEAVLKAVYRILDCRHSFGSSRNSDMAYESLKLVVADARQADE